MEFPQVDLPVDLIAWTDVTEDILNIYKQSCRLKACIFALCTEGRHAVSINRCTPKQGDFETLFPAPAHPVSRDRKKRDRFCCL